MTNDADFFSTFLKYGSLGVLALICVIVLGFNTVNLNRLIKEASPETIREAKPLLQRQMSISLIGLIVIGGALFFLTWSDQNAKHALPVRLDMLPWDSDVDAKYRPQVLIDQKLIAPPEPSIRVPCLVGQESDLRVDVGPYVDYRLLAASRNRALLTQAGQ